MGHFNYICVMRVRLFLLLFFAGLSVFATHNRSGYISYCYNNSTGKYTFRIYTYTNYQSVSADRCEQTLYFLDINGQLTDSLTCPRVNGTGPCPNGGNGVDGVLIVPPNGNYGGVKENVYQASKALNPSIYVLTMIDPNRDAGILNLGVPDSKDVAFAIVDTMYAWNFFGAKTNCTPVFSNPPIQNACAGQPWCYNPGAVDPENDSLDFTLIRSFEADPNNSPGGVEPIATASIPSGMSVDRHTGNLCWLNVSPNQGEYNVALLIKEYRKNAIDGKRYLVGETVFDIQILVIGCSNPGIVVTQPPNACVIAGQSYSVAVTASVSPGGAADPPINLSASGLPLTGSTIGHLATFSASSFSTSATGNFVWSPDCQAVQSNPYYVTFQGYDSHSPVNANYSTFNIQVISPPPTNVVATAQGSFVNLTWNAPAGCAQNSGNTIQKYLIFRNDSCNFFVPSPCQTGVPPSTGYVLVGNTSYSVTSFTDSNFGQGLTTGNSYSYIIVAQYADGSLSVASASTVNTCVTIKLDIPLMMKVSVDTTDALVGQMKVWWKNPFVNNGALDTIANPGPYQYILQRRTGSGTAYTQAFTVTESSFYQLKKLADTTFVDVNLNTLDSSYYYKVDFYSNGNFMGSANPARSVFLTATPHDKSVVLNWTAITPWINNKYYIFKQHLSTQPNPLAYDLIDSCTATTYTVTHLTNGHNYCFKVLSKGQYSNPLVARYIMNFSEKVCATPFDDVPPCQPSLYITGNCNSSFNSLVWTNPNHTCGIVDVVKYYIYYTPVKDSTLSLMDSVLNPNDTTYATDFSNSIAGCFVIVAVDSAGNHSPLNNEICTDNCPEYELPNIFTPNGDNTNDQYIPVKNKYIKNVEFTMYNRWGEIVFETTDPALKWDGKSKQMKQPVSDGTYYYICQVNELHYYGIKSYKLKGFVQVLH